MFQTYPSEGETFPPYLQEDTQVFLQ